MKKCPSCGKEVSLLASKCRYCGDNLVDVVEKEKVVIEEERIVKKEEPKVNSPKTSKKNRSLKSIVGIVLILVGIIGFLGPRINLGLISGDGPDKKSVDNLLNLSKDEVINKLGNPTTSDASLLEYNDIGLNFMLTSDKVFAITILKKK